MSREIDELRDAGKFGNAPVSISSAEPFPVNVITDCGYIAGVENAEEGGDAVPERCVLHSSDESPTDSDGAAPTLTSILTGEDLCITGASLTYFRPKTAL